MQYLGLEIDLDKDNELTEFSKTLLTKYYLHSTETSPQQAFARAAVAYSNNDMEFAQRIYDYVSAGWFMYASPVLSNAPLPGENWRGLPISCFLTFVPDTLEGLIDHTSELRWLSVKGGGVGGHWSQIRAVSDKAPGPIPFLKTVDSDIIAYHQGKTRRGSYAAYLDISHPDIVEFIQMRLPTGGDPNRKCFNLHNAVNITDAFMTAVANDSNWELIDPDDGSVRDQLNARELWQLLLETRFKTGEPYLNFIDTANAALPEAQKQLGLRIQGSNLCNEIHLATDEKRTAVCCLSSLNLEKYDEWKGTNIVRDLIRFLDNVLSIFIQEAPPVLNKAVKSAIWERSLGLGAMGFHSYLQKKGIPWENAIAKAINIEMFSYIKKEALLESKLLGEERGVPPDLQTSPVELERRRNAHLLAIAPNANSSIIMGTSSSIEPIKSNAYTHRTRAGSFLVKNRHLDELLKARLDEDELEAVWKSVITNSGSVQHLDCLDDFEKQIFRTAFELDQRWVVEHAAARQKYICQGQSVNLFFPAHSDRSYVNETHLKAWKSGLKGLYYLRTNSGAEVSVSHKIERQALSDYAGADEDTCLGCEG